MKTLRLSFAVVLLLAAYGVEGALSRWQGYTVTGAARASISVLATPQSLQTVCPGAAVSVFVAGTSAPAAIYSDSGGAHLLPGGTTSSDDAGYAYFYVLPGKYTLRITGCGIVTSLPDADIGGSVSGQTVYNIQTDCNAKGDGITDDGPAIQTCINKAITTGGTVYLPDVPFPNVYLTNEELTVSGSLYQINIAGGGPLYGGAQNRGATIRAGASIQSVLHISNSNVHVSNVRFDGNYLATYCVLNGPNAEFGFFEQVHVFRGLKDGFSLAATGVNDNTTFETCWALSNGTILATSGIRGQYQSGGVDSTWHTQPAAGTVSTTAGSAIITGSGTFFTALGLRVNDFIRIGPTLLTAEYRQIRSVDSDTQITLRPLDTAVNTAAGQQWAVFTGAGIYGSGLSGVGSNGICQVRGGLYRGNVIGIASDGAYGWHIGPTTQLESSAFVGLALGFAEDSVAQSSPVLDRLYFEGNTIASIWLGEVHAQSIMAPVSGDPSVIIRASHLTFRNDAYYGATTFALYGGFQMDVSDFNMVGNVSINGYRHQSFVIEIANNGGTLQHRIMSDSLTGDYPRLAGKITAPTLGYVNTPTISGVVGFTSGAGVLSANKLVLDTAADQCAGLVDGRQDIRVSSITVAKNSTGAAKMVDMMFESDNVNGVTLCRPVIQMTDLTGAAVNFDTTAIASGKSVAFRISAWFR